MAFGLRGAAPFRTTPSTVTDGYTPGQWVQTPNHRKPSRFVGYRPDGTAFLLHPVGKGKHARVSMAAFRLARSKPLVNVLSTVEVTGRIVEQTVTDPTTSNDPLGQAVAAIAAWL